MKNSKKFTVIILFLLVFSISLPIILPKIQIRKESYGANAIPFTPVPAKQSLQLETFQIPTPTLQPTFSPQANTNASVNSTKVTKIACGQSNWSGYLYTPPANTAQTIASGNWTVSTMTCGDTSEDKEGLSQWVGIDGNSPVSWIAQVGSYDMCQNGTPEYFAWTEAYPKPFVGSIGSQYAVKPGDQFSATINMTSIGNFQTKMTDTTQGWSYQTPLTFGSNYTPVANGEMILEDEGFYTNQPLPSFTQEPFTNNMYSINNSTPAPIENGPGLQCLYVDQNGIVKDNTSSLTGSNFTISWTHS